MRLIRSVDHFLLLLLELLELLDLRAGVKALRVDVLLQLLEGARLLVGDEERAHHRRHHHAEQRETDDVGASLGLLGQVIFRQKT